MPWANWFAMFEIEIDQRVEEVKRSSANTNSTQVLPPYYRLWRKPKRMVQRSQCPTQAAVPAKSAICPVNLYIQLYHLCAIIKLSNNKLISTLHFLLTPASLVGITCQPRILQHSYGDISRRDLGETVRANAHDKFYIFILKGNSFQ